LGCMGIVGNLSDIRQGRSISRYFSRDDDFCSLFVA